MGISFTSKLSQVRHSSVTGVQAVGCGLAGGICCLYFLTLGCVSGSFWLMLLGLKEVTVKPGDENRDIFLQSVLFGPCSCIWRACRAICKSR